MKYPFIALSTKVEIHPLCKNLEGEPLILDLSQTSDLFEKVDVHDQKAFQKWLDKKMAGRFSWGVAAYLENRQKVLSVYPQMVEEKRWYHLGLDIIVPLGTQLFAPLAARVALSGYEEGDGNYGAHVLLAHESDAFETFYSFYGHLNRDKLPEKGRKFNTGDPFACIGDFHENGNWFYHTHLQVLTQKALAAGYMSKGYCSGQDLADMDSLCPSPLSLFVI